MANESIVLIQEPFSHVALDCTDMLFCSLSLPCRPHSNKANVATWSSAIRQHCRFSHLIHSSSWPTYSFVLYEQLQLMRRDTESLFWLWNVPHSWTRVARDGLCQCGLWSLHHPHSHWERTLALFPLSYLIINICVFIHSQQSCPKTHNPPLILWEIPVAHTHWDRHVYREGNPGVIK